MRLKGVKEVFEGLDLDAVENYRKYWEGLTVDNNADYFRRWLFAFMSVHTTWESNVQGYRAIADFTQWLGDDDELLRRLKAGRAGLYNNRARFISAFAEDFWGDPASYWPTSSNKIMASFRDNLCDKILGLGSAKTSFALELAFPTKAKITCLDVHMLRLYGHDQRKKAGLYNKLETDWVGKS